MPTNKKQPAKKSAAKTPTKNAAKNPPKTQEKTSGESTPVVGMGADLTAELSKIDAEWVSDGNAIELPGVVPTGSLSLDAAIGRGGWPMGRMAVLTGAEGVGKSTLCLTACASVQAMGGVAVYLDYEHKLDKTYAKALGVDTDNIVLSQAKDIESGMRLVDNLINVATDKYGDVPLLVIFDSINAALSKAMFEGEWDGKFIGSGARAWSQNLPRLMARLSNRKIALLMVSQHRVGFDFKQQAHTEKVSGGNAIKYYTSLVVDLWRGGFVETGTVRTASKVNAKCIKNQVAAPFQEASFNINFGTGIDKINDILTRAEDLRLISVSGAGWYEMPNPWDEEGEPLKWQGLGGFHKLNKKHEGLSDYLLELIRNKEQEPQE